MKQKKNIYLTKRHMSQHCALCAAVLEEGNPECHSRCVWPPIGSMACKIQREDNVKVIVYPTSLLQERTAVANSKMKINEKNVSN